MQAFRRGRTRLRRSFPRIVPGFAPTALSVAAALLTAMTTPTQAQTPPARTYADAAATDPITLGWMQGFPPAPDKVISFSGKSNGFPRHRWTFSHVRELVPTVSVWRGPGPVSALPRAERDIGGVPFVDADGTRRTFADMLALTYTDGILVMHKGKVVYEKYFGALQPQLPHAAFSITKSFVGTLAAMLAVEGKLDPSAPVTRYVPELADTAYGDATVRQVMDMTIGVKFSEDYADPKAEVNDYARAGGMIPRAPDYAGPRTFYEFLTTLRKEGEHDRAFAYKTVNAEVLTWIVQRASGVPLPKLMSDKLWQPLGAEEDAYFTVDSIGTPGGGGAISTTLRDLARFGEAMRNDGRFNGRQVIPGAVVAEIRGGGDRAKFAKSVYAHLPGWSYRDMWWVSHDDHGVFEARGIFGQRIHVDPKAEMTIVRYASHPIAGNAANDPITLRAYRALALALMQR